MDNIFNMIKSGRKKVPEGILLTIKFNEGHDGVLNVYKHAGLDLESYGSDRVYFQVKGGLGWSGLFENSDYLYKNKEPFNRGSSTSYLGYGFAQLDTIITQNGGRFLSLRNAENTSLFSCVDNYPAREAGVHFDADHVGEFSQYLGHILPRLGVPREDAGIIVGDIFTKLGYSTL